MSEETYALSERQIEFLKKLAALCEEYNAGIEHCVFDDATHILVDGKVAFAGFIDKDATSKIREALSTGEVTVSKSFS